MKAFFLCAELCPDVRFAQWLEIGTAAAMLRAAQWSVDAFCWRSPRQAEELLGRVRALEPDLVALPLAYDQRGPALSMLRQIKANRPQTITVGCGIWPTLAPEEALHTPGDPLDAVILGEWEEPLADFAKALERQRQYSTIPNVWVRLRPDETRRTPMRRPAEADAFPAPDRDLLPYREALQINGGEAPIQASRSCSRRCGFCHEPVLARMQNPQAKEPAARLRSPKSVLQEASALLQRFAPQRFVFTDCLFPSALDWLEEFSGLWRQYIQRPFTVQGCTELHGGQVLDFLRQAGCDRMIVGVETGDEVLRRAVCDRNLDNERLLEFRRELEANGIALIASVMIGLPGETPLQLESTLSLVQRLEPFEIRTRVYTPLPQTPVGQSAFAAYPPGAAGLGPTGAAGAQPMTFSFPHPPISTGPPESLSHPVSFSELPLAPDVSALNLPPATQEQLSRVFDRLFLLDSALRARAPGRKQRGYFDFMAQFSQGRLLSPHRRTARLTVWRCGEDAREVLTMRAPTEFTVETELRLHSGLAFGLTTQPAFKGLRPHQCIHFGIKAWQDGRNIRLFRKVLIPALDPDARRWHDFLIPLRNLRPGPFKISFQVWVDDKELEALAPGEEIWGGWSRPHLVDQLPSGQTTTPIPLGSAPDETATPLPHSLLPAEFSGGQAARDHAGGGAAPRGGAKDAALPPSSSPHSAHSSPHPAKELEKEVARARGELRRICEERDTFRQRVEQLSLTLVNLQDALTKTEKALQEANRRAQVAEAEIKRREEEAASRKKFFSFGAKPPKK